MKVERILPIVGVSLALCLGLGVGLAVSVWAGQGPLGPQSGDAAANNVPQVTSTPVLYDLQARLGWDSRFPCPGPVLSVASYAAQWATCPEHLSYVMRLENSNGEWRDYAAGPVHGGSTTNVQVGRDVPFGWLQSMPLTLTVDYNNSIPESNENNNTATLNAPPPTPGACSTSTAVASPTRLPTSTPTVTCAPRPTDYPDLMGSATWSSRPCPAPVLKLRTEYMTLYGVCYAGASHMRLSNSAGDHMDFPVSELHGNHAYDEQDCPVGPCMPPSWLTSLPLTLTVDVLNEVNEGYYGEGNNTSRLLTPPPPCGSVTETPTPTITTSVTDTPTPAMTATPCSMPFSDVGPPDYFYEAVRYLYCHGAVSGYADGTFRPGNNVTRGQICKIVVLALDVPLYTPPRPTYCDVPSDHPFYVYIETYRHLQEPCEICGWECTFRPYNLTTRGQLTKIVALTACWPLYTPTTPTFSDVPTSHPFYAVIETAYHYGVISGYADRTFRPNNNITRGQVSKVAYRAALVGRFCPGPVPTQVATAPGPVPTQVAVATAQTMGRPGAGSKWRFVEKYSKLELSFLRD